VQLSHNSSSLQNSGLAYNPNDPSANQTPQQNTTRALANNQFVETRLVKKPWDTMNMPDWARSLKRMRFQGQRVDSGTPEMGLGRTLTYLTFDLETAYVGQTFTAYRTTLTMRFEGMPAMQPTTGMSASGPGMLSGIWMDPAALAQLRTGQLIDQDNNVGIKFGCEYAGQANDGTTIVILAGGNELWKATATYDAATGRLIAFARIEKSPTTGGMVTTQMQLVGME
jgi:hypothetical protein